MATVKAQRTDISGALLQTKVQGRRSLKCAMYYALFSLFNDIFILPILVITILYLGLLLGGPDPSTTPNVYLCKCCADNWHWDNEYCCTCTNTGDDMTEDDLYESGIATAIPFVFGFIGGYDMLMLAVSLFSFLALCLWGTEVKEACVKGMSLFGLRYKKEGMIVALIARLLLFIAATILLLTKPDIHCSCDDNGTFPMEFGTEYTAFKACYTLMVVYLFFNLLFLLARRILLGLLRNVKITEEMVVFRLCYVRVEQT
eukprot:449626_1